MATEIALDLSSSIGLTSKQSTSKSIKRVQFSVYRLCIILYFIDQLDQGRFAQNNSCVAHKAIDSGWHVCCQGLMSRWGLGKNTKSRFFLSWHVHFWELFAIRLVQHKRKGQGSNQLSHLLPTWGWEVLLPWLLAMRDLADPDVAFRPHTQPETLPGYYKPWIIQSLDLKPKGSRQIG